MQTKQEGAASSFKSKRTSEPAPSSSKKAQAPGGVEPMETKQEGAASFFKSMCESMAAMQPMGSSAPAMPLAQIPRPLQHLVIEAMLGMRCERATDIWFENEGVITLLRGGVQWTLNATASKLWQRMDCTVAELVDACKSDYPDTDADEVRFYVCDFVQQAATIGLVVLTKGGNQNTKAA